MTSFSHSAVSGLFHIFGSTDGTRITLFRSTHPLLAYGDGPNLAVVVRMAAPIKPLCRDLRVLFHAPGSVITFEPVVSKRTQPRLATGLFLPPLLTRAYLTSHSRLYRGPSSGHMEPDSQTRSVFPSTRTR